MPIENVRQIHVVGSNLRVSGKEEDFNYQPNKRHK